MAARAPSMKKFPITHQRVTQYGAWKSGLTYDEADRTLGEIECTFDKANDRIQCALKQIEDGDEDASDDIENSAEYPFEDLSDGGDEVANAFDDVRHNAR